MAYGIIIKHSSLWVGVLGFKWSGGKKRHHRRMGGYTLGKMKNLYLTVSTSSLCSKEEYSGLKRTSPANLQLTVRTSSLARKVGGKLRHITLSLALVSKVIHA